MREETRRRLERALWRERTKKIGIGVAVLAVVGALTVFKDFDSRMENIRVPGTVLSVEPLNTTSTKLVESGLSVGVALDNGRRVTVMAYKKTDPHVGDHVEVTEHRHSTGRITYTWK